MLKLGKVFQAYQLASLLDSVCSVFLYFYFNFPNKPSSHVRDLLRGSYFVQFSVPVSKQGQGCPMLSLRCRRHDYASASGLINRNKFELCF